MPVNPTEFPDDASGTYPADVKGWEQMRLSKFRAEPKGERTWFLLEFINDGGRRASTSLNLFSKPEADGKKKANEISLGVLGSLWKAAGLSETDRPAANAREIVKALNALEGNLEVDCYIAPDDKEYMTARKFRKASGAKIDATGPAF